MAVVVPSLMMGIVDRCVPLHAKTVAVHRPLGCSVVPALVRTLAVTHHKVGCIVGHVRRAREPVEHLLPVVGWIVGLQATILHMGIVGALLFQQGHDSPLF